YAASLYNMMRYTGSAIGISLVTNLMSTRQQIHQAYLGQHFTPFTASQLSQLGPQMPGSPTFNFTQGLIMNQNHGLGLIYATVQQQAELLAYNDVYRTLAILAAMFVPAFLLLRRAKGTT